MSYKPQRTFNGSEGEPSIDRMGPSAIAKDIDTINKMFDPNTVHDDGSPGGISLENLKFSMEDTKAVIYETGSLKYVRLNSLGDLEGSADKVTWVPVNARAHMENKSNPHDVKAAQVENTGLSFIPGTNVQTVLSNMDAVIAAAEPAAHAAATYETKASAAAAVVSVEFEPTGYEHTGKFRITTKGGEVRWIDTNLEKVVTNFTYDAANKRLVLTTPDGPAYVSLADLVGAETLHEGQGISVADSGNIITISIKNGSITESMLSTGLYNAVYGAVNFATLKAQEAAASAANAATYRTQAQDYSVNAGNAANSAAGSANTAAARATESKSYAVGETGTRPGEATDNAKYYKEQAQNVLASAVQIVPYGKPYALNQTPEILGYNYPIRILLYNGVYYGYKTSSPGIARSIDGVTWEQELIPGATTAYAVPMCVADEKLWVSVNGKIAYKDGAGTWTILTSTNVSLIPSMVKSSSCYICTPDIGAAVTSVGRSIDGINWQNVSVTTQTTPYFTAILVKGGSIYIFADGQARTPSRIAQVFVSTDGQSWTRSNTDTILGSVAIGPDGNFYGNEVIGASTDPGRLMTSADGITWTQVGSSLYNNKCCSVDVLDGKFFVLNQTKKQMFYGADINNLQPLWEVIPKNIYNTTLGAGWVQGHAASLPSAWLFGVNAQWHVYKNPKRLSINGEFVDNYIALLSKQATYRKV